MRKSFNEPSYTVIAAPAAKKVEGCLLLVINDATCDAVGSSCSVLWLLCMTVCKNVECVADIQERRLETQSDVYNGVYKLNHNRLKLIVNTEWQGKGDKI